MAEPLKVALAGLGTVGGGVVRLLDANRDLIARRAGRAIEVVAVSARDRAKNRGFDLGRFDWHDDTAALAQANGVGVVVELVDELEVLVGSCVLLEEELLLLLLVEVLEELEGEDVLVLVRVLVLELGSPVDVGSGVVLVGSGVGASGGVELRELEVTFPAGGSSLTGSPSSAPIMKSVQMSAGMVPPVTSA